MSRLLDRLIHQGLTLTAMTHSPLTIPALAELYFAYAGKHAVPAQPNFHNQSVKAKTMTALVIIDITVHDLPAMQRYEQPAVALMALHGGKVLVKELKPEIYEGAWSPTWLVVLKFPSRSAVSQFFAAEEYQPLKAVRLAAATSNGVIVVGN